MQDDDPEEITRQLALTPPASASRTPTALVEWRLRLRAEAEIAVAARRKRRNSLLTDPPDSRWLDALWVRLKVMAGTAKSDYERQELLRHRDAVQEASKRNTITGLIRMFESEAASLKSPEKIAYGKKIIAAHERVVGPAPEFPCPLETAMRWVVNAPFKLSWPELKGDFSNV